MLYNKSDVLNAINNYIIVLKGDTKRENNEQIKQVLNNVIQSLSDIITALNK